MPATATADVARVPADRVPATAAGEAPTGSEESIELDDPVAPLEPLRRRSGREEDRIRALALYTAGRVAERQQKYAEALRYYQRAFRFDPEATAPLKEIVPLAFSLDRQAEAVRYALLLAEHDPDDPAMLRRLAIYLTESGDTQRALSFYEKALALQSADDKGPSLLVARTEMGRLYFVAGQFDKAAEQFAIVFDALMNPDAAGLNDSMQKALIGKPELTFQLMGESFLADGQLDRAAAAFEKLHEARPNEGIRAYNLARVALKRKQPAQAIARLQPYFEKHLATQGTGPYQVLADALDELGQSDRLIARLQEIRAGHESNVPLTYFLAQHLREAGQLDEAAALYTVLIDKNPKRPPIEAFRGLVEIRHQQKDADKLLETLGEAVGRVGTLAPLADAGKTLLDDTESSKAVLQAAQRQLEDDPDQLPYGKALVAALVADELQEFDVAGRFFERAMKANPEKAGETLVSWGLGMFLAEQNEQAAKVFQRGIDEKVLADNEAALYYYMAGALEMAGRTDEAIEAANKAAELKKDSPRFAGRAAWIQFHAKRYDDARQSYAKLLEKYGDEHESDEARQAVRDARLVLSNIAVMQDQLEESEQWLEDLLDEFPEDIGALNDLGYLWADAGKHLELAHEMIQKAVAHEPKNMAYRDSLGWVLFRMGRFKEAVAELQAAAAAENSDGVILEHLGDALAKNDDLPAAIDAWNRAAEAFDKASQPDKADQVRQKAAQAKQDDSTRN